MGIKNFSLVHDLFGIEVYIANLRYRIRILIEGKSWTRIECGMWNVEFSIPMQTLYKHFVIVGA